MKYIDVLRFYENEFKNKDLEPFAASYLLADVLNVDTSVLFSCLNEEANKDKLKQYKKYCSKYLKYVPAQYITSHAYFYNLDLYVDKRVLIPRKETELMVEMLLNENLEKKLNIVDLCSGSGCIGLAIKNARKNFNVTCIDISSRANKVAKLNSDKLGLDIKIIKNDLLKNYQENIDILISNPPYIAFNDNEVSKSTFKYEPHIALYAKNNGLNIYERIFNQLNKINFKKAYFEIGYKQKKDLTKLLKKYSFKYEFRKDYSNKDRYLIIEKVL